MDRGASGSITGRAVLCAIVTTAQPPIQPKISAYSSRLNQTERQPIIHLHVILELRKRGTIPQPPLYFRFVLLDARKI
jgi:hypothetical protein